MQCNSMFVITSHWDIVWPVTHSSPINRVGGHVFHTKHRMFQNYSEYMYLPKNVRLYGELEEGTDKSTLLEARFRDARYRQ